MRDLGASINATWGDQNVAKYFCNRAGLFQGITLPHTILMLVEDRGF
jgi:hypothetical protein